MTYFYAQLFAMDASPVLVHHIRVGDPLVLGASAGAMIADTQATRDVLCLAGQGA
jgi:ferredoxin-NADP reductase